MCLLGCLSISRTWCTHKGTRTIGYRKQTSVHCACININIFSSCGGSRVPSFLRSIQCSLNCISVPISFILLVLVRMMCRYRCSSHFRQYKGSHSVFHDKYPSKACNFSHGSWIRWQDTTVVYDISQKMAGRINHVKYLRLCVI